MKKLLAILGAATLLFATACDNAAGTDPVPAPTVNVGTLSDLPATGAESEPADEAASLAIVEDVLYGIMSLTDSGEADGDFEGYAGARATESGTEPISYVSEDGKVTINGTATYSMTTPDQDTRYTANVWYNDVMAMKSSANILGTMTEASVEGDFHTYGVSGKFGLIMELEFKHQVQR